MARKHDLGAHPGIRVQGAGESLVHEASCSIYVFKLYPEATPTSQIVVGLSGLGNTTSSYIARKQQAAHHDAAAFNKDMVVFPRPIFGHHIVNLVVAGNRVILNEQVTNLGVHCGSRYGEELEKCRSRVFEMGWFPSCQPYAE